MKYLIYGGTFEKHIVSTLDNLEDVVSEGEYTVYQLKEVKKIKVEKTIKVTETKTDNEEIKFLINVTSMPLEDILKTLKDNPSAITNIINKHKSMGWR